MRFVPAIQPPAQASAGAWCLAFVGAAILLPDTAEPVLAPQPLAAWRARASAAHYLGRLDALDCWALALPEPPPGWHASPLRSAMMALPEPLAALAGRAAQVLDWDRSNRYCGVCGSATVRADAERARRCPSCGEVAYPRITPAMMVLVWREGELLLARAPRFAPGVYSALAGFVEAGESLEDCIHREVAEEVGVAVADLRYFGSQSWPFPHSLMVAYTARWAGGEIVAQPDEIESARWFALGALPGIPPQFSISGHLIRDTVQAMREHGRP